MASTKQGSVGYADKMILAVFGGLIALILITKGAFGLSMLLSHGEWIMPSQTGLQVWAHLHDLSVVVPRTAHAHGPISAKTSGPPTILFLIVVVVITALFGLLGYFAFKLYRRYLGGYKDGVNHPVISNAYSVKAVLAKARFTRPWAWKIVHGEVQDSEIGGDEDEDEVRTTKERLEQELKSPLGVGFYVGRSPQYGDMWASVEDSFVAIGPPRQGKSTGIVIPRLKEWPGPAVVTSVRNDVEQATVEFRQTGGRPVFAFDPEHHSQLPDFRFSLTRGCENPLVAQRRASLLLSQMSTSSGKDNDFWSNSAQSVLRILLLAAAAQGSEFDTVMRWLKSPKSLSASAKRIFEMLKGLPEEWGEDLERITTMATKASETYEGIVQTAIAALEAFVDPRLLTQLSPRGAPPPDPDEPDRLRQDEQTDLKDFLRQRGTLYITASENVQKAIAPVIVVLITEIIEAAKQIAQEHGRMDPPLLLALDEVANIAPIPNLAEIYSVAGGSGITMLSILQTTAQAKKRWGTEGFQALWGATTVRIILGGVTDMETLREMAALAGTKDETQISVSQSSQGSSTSTSTVEKERMRPEEFYRVAVGEAMVVGKGQPPIKVKMGPAPEKYWPSSWKEQHTKELVK